MTLLPRHIIPLLLLLALPMPLLRAQDPAQQPNFIDRSINYLTQVAQDGAIPLGPVNIDPFKTVSYSLSRGVYLGLGIETNERFSKRFKLDGFAGYWFHLRDIDYGAGATWFIAPEHDMSLRLDYRYVSEPLGEFGGMMEEGVGMLDEDNFKFTFFENVYVRQHGLRLTYATRFAQHFKAFVTVGNYRRRYLEQFCLDTLAPALPEDRFTVAELKLHFVYSTYPNVWLVYQHGFPGIMQSVTEFDRLKLQIGQNFYTRSLGVSKVLFQAGYASAGCPVMETFNILSAYMPVGLYSPGCFNTMRFDEFFCDRFAAVFLCHNFGGMLWHPDSPWFQPELNLVTNIGWGDMRRANNCPDKIFKTMERGYFESGVVVKNLLCLPLVKIGIGAFYRYGPYAYGSFKKDIALKYSLEFDL